jgi:hypothetical protein
MSIRYPAGFIRIGYDPLKVPDAPTIGTATAGDTQASVAFTAPTNTGGSAVSAYYAVSNPGQITGTAASSPVTVTGLTNGTAYTFAVWALNTYGPSAYSAASGSVTPFLPTRALIAGGSGGGNVIQYITIDTLGNAIDFGDLPSNRDGIMSCGSTTQAFFATGTTTNIVTNTFASLGNSTNVGALTVARAYGAGCNSSTRGVFAGGYLSVTGYNTIDYITMSSAGTASSFGQLSSTGNGRYGCAGLSNSTRGVFAGGNRRGAANYYSDITYITIASTGNTTYFGELTDAIQAIGGTSNSTRGLFVSGEDGVGAINTIQYITIATTGSRTDFGDLISPSTYMYGNNHVANTTRAVMFGNPSSAKGSYVTIASTGNATNFGDLTVTTYWAGAISAANGGTQ